MNFDTDIRYQEGLGAMISYTQIAISSHISHNVSMISYHDIKVWLYLENIHDIMTLYNISFMIYVDYNISKLYLYMI